MAKDEKKTAAPAPPAPPPVKKILVIDDDSTIILCLQADLSNRGYQVTSARDGAEGLKRILELKPDLIITDTMMPQITGYELIQKLRALQEPIKDTPVIVMSAREKFAPIFEDLRIQAFLPKPFQAELLAQEVKSAIGLPPPKPEVK